MNHVENNARNEANETKNVTASSSDGQKSLCDFMKAAGQPITFVEAREIWNDMNATNNSSFPLLANAYFDLSRQSLKTSQMHSINIDLSYASMTSESEDNSSTDGLSEVEDVDRVDDVNDIEEREEIEEGAQRSDTKMTAMITEEEISNLSDKILVLFAKDLATRIKDTYSIRKRDDSSEFVFILAAIGLLWTAVVSIAIAGYFHAETNPKIGTFNRVTLRSILMESFILFAAELIWECFLSWIVLRYNIKINYTRKLGNLLKVPKYFVADLFPDFTSTALSMATALAINQTLFCAMYYRRSRERVPFFSYVFLSQDRREDRPDTLIFQVTEDIMRFAIYFPFKLLVVNVIGSPAIIFIPIAVNNIGDGLAEPVGVAFGKHKYSTTALYYQGKFFNGNFTRSYEGSACVFFTTLIIVAGNYNAFSTWQFWLTMTCLPPLMTIAEAKAPHTNDGPFLALLGCSFLSAIFLIGN